MSVVRGLAFRVRAFYPEGHHSGYLSGVKAPFLIDTAACFTGIAFRRRLLAGTPMTSMRPMTSRKQDCVNLGFILPRRRCRTATAGKQQNCLIRDVYSRRPQAHSQCREQKIQCLFLLNIAMRLRALIGYRLYSACFLFSEMLLLSFASSATSHPTLKRRDRARRSRSQRDWRPAQDLADR